MGEPAWNAVRSAAADGVSGASEIGFRAAEALAALPRSDLEEAVAALIRGHPSMAPLWRLGTEVLDSADHVAAATDFARRLRAEVEGVAARAASLLSGTVVLYSYSGTVVAAVIRAGVRAICAWSEPGGAGVLTATRLAERGIEAEVVEDKEAIEHAARAEAILTGADAVGPGGVVNEVGTRRLAEAAGAAGRPAIVVAGSSKLIAADLPAPHPFERTPLVAFSAIVTEVEVLDPEEAGRRALGFPLHPALAKLLAAIA